MTNDIIEKNIKKGGKVIASGGFGCVFSPMLRCQGSLKREKDKISKLMTEKNATLEYEEINSIKKKLDVIKNYQNYFLLKDITICKPEKLTTNDLQNINKKCKLLKKYNITRKNINTSLEKIRILNMPDGGIPVDDYLYENGSFKKLYLVHLKLVQLLKNGIVNMNKKNVYHSDIKDSNVLIDDKNELKTRLIDWGLSTQYVPFQNNPFPENFRNRPFQFNVPFSVILFSDSFIEKYTNFIKNGGNTKEETELKPFVISYIHFWMKERGSGHYKFINEIMYNLFSHKLNAVTKEDMTKIIETQITMDFIVNYIIDILIHFTKFKKDGSLNLREYFDNVFIKIVDIWGFICIYYPVIEMFSNNYNRLTDSELLIFNKLQLIFVEYLYNPRHEPIDLNKLYSDIEHLGSLIYAIVKENVYNPYNTMYKKNTSKIKSLSKKNNRQNNRQNNSIKTNTKKLGQLIKKSTTSSTFSFKRKQPVKRFKKPIFFNKK